MGGVVEKDGQCPRQCQAATLFGQFTGTMPPRRARALDYAGESIEPASARELRWREPGHHHGSGKTRTRSSTKVVTM